MQYSLALLAAAAVVSASPFNRRQAVTSAIAPTAPAPSGCMPNYSGTFGIAVMNLTSAAGTAAVTTLGDGQPGASTGAAPVTTISDGQPQATTGVAPVTTIADGQPQATTGVAPVSTIADGQPQAPTMTVAPVSQISDGQIQATTKTMAPINQIGDGQIQNQQTVKPVSQISDGQIQATTAAAVSQISDGQIQASTAAPVSQISDGQIQATTHGATATAVSQISDGQIQATTHGVTATPVNTLSDGQPQASTTAAVKTLSDGQPQASPSAKSSASGMSYVACKSDSTLQVTLEGGILKDNQGRTGYIAANYQFQFDGPPQAGAIYTAGWSVCGNNSVALGGSAVFYQCLSGNFYNLYDRNWAAQCNPITIQTVNLQTC